MTGRRGTGPTPTPTVQGLNQLDQASPSYWRWWQAQLASWMALLGGRVLQELQPSLAIVGRLETLVSWWRPVYPWGTGRACWGHICGRASASASVLGHEEPLLVNHQSAERGAPASRQPSWLFLYCFLYKTATAITVQFSVELNRLGEWCHGSCTSLLDMDCFFTVLLWALLQTVVPSDFLFLRFWWKAQALVYCITTTLTEQETRSRRLCLDPPPLILDIHEVTFAPAHFGQPWGTFV